jgi:hypothetical protein
VKAWQALVLGAAFIALGILLFTSIQLSIPLPITEHGISARQSSFLWTGIVAIVRQTRLLLIGPVAIGLWLWVIGIRAIRAQRDHEPTPIAPPPVARETAADKPRFLG